MTTTPNRAIIQRIVAGKPEDADLNEWIAGELRRYSDVEAEARLMLRERKQREAEYRLAMRVLDERVIANQAACRHYGATRHGDPSGGNGSFHCCEDCGKTW